MSKARELLNLYGCIYSTDVTQIVEIDKKELSKTWYDIDDPKRINWPKEKLV